MTDHPLKQFSLKRDPKHAFVVMIPECDRWLIVKEGKFLEDERGLSLDIFKSRHKETKEQNEEDTKANINNWLQNNGYVDGCQSFETQINKIQRGDLIQLEWLQYRNDGSYLWDGNKVINLCYEYDDYGTVPPEFSFPEFPFTYFEYRILHNNMVFLREDLKCQILANITFGILDITKNVQGSDKGVAYSSFTYNNETCIVLGYPDCVLYEDNSHPQENYKTIPLDDFKRRFINLFEKEIRDGIFHFEWEGPLDFENEPKIKLAVIC